MFFAQINFPFPQDMLEDDEAQDAVSELLGTLWKNGQVYTRNYSLLGSPQGFCSLVHIAAEDALEDKYNSEWTEKDIEKFIELGGQRPHYVVIGEELESPGPCECDEVPELIMYTTYLSMESPLRCGSCFQSVPLYRVPPTHVGEYWDLRTWEADYQACDTLQMHCTTLERAATREMSKLDSNLTRDGLEVRDKIAALTGKSVYYYLYRWHGRSSAAEKKRLCPGCGGAWLLPEPWHKFDFKCKACCLVSNIALNVG